MHHVFPHPSLPMCKTSAACQDTIFPEFWLHCWALFALHCQEMWWFFQGAVGSRWDPLCHGYLGETWESQGSVLTLRMAVNHVYIHFWMLMSIVSNLKNSAVNICRCDFRCICNTCAHVFVTSHLYKFGKKKSAHQQTKQLTNYLVSLVAQEVIMKGYERNGW